MLTKDKSMNCKNVQMESMLMSLENCLDHKGVLGYAIARNYRTLSDTAHEYLLEKAKVIQEHGKPSEDHEGMVEFSGDDAQEAIKGLGELAVLSHDVTICTVPMQNAAEEMTAKEIIGIAWMLDEDKEDDDADPRD